MAMAEAVFLGLVGALVAASISMALLLPAFFILTFVSPKKSRVPVADTEDATTAGAAERMGQQMGQEVVRGAPGILIPFMPFLAVSSIIALALGPRGALDLFLTTTW